MPKEKTEAASYVPFPVRFPPEYLEVIKDQAIEGRRPINTQILMIIEDWMKRKRLERRRREATSA